MITAALSCCHWDRIEMPNGPVSKARCKYCGRVREYETTYGERYNNTPLNVPATTAMGQKLKRNWEEPLEWKGPVWRG